MIILYAFYYEQQLCWGPLRMSFPECNLLYSVYNNFFQQAIHISLITVAPPAFKMF
jgi:hypothetical protein